MCVNAAVLHVQQAFVLLLDAALFVLPLRPFPQKTCRRKTLPDMKTPKKKTNQTDVLLLLPTESNESASLRPHRRKCCPANLVSRLWRMRKLATDQEETGESNINQIKILNQQFLFQFPSDKMCCRIWFCCCCCVITLLSRLLRHVTVARRDSCVLFTCAFGLFTCL